MSDDIQQFIVFSIFCSLHNFVFVFVGGRKEDIYFDKITCSIRKLCYGLNMEFIDPVGTISLIVKKKKLMSITDLNI